MEFITDYTTIVAPVIFFLAGILIVMLINKFIGKQKKQDGKSSIG